MSYKDIINNLKPFDYSKYKDITSNEKLMIYSAYILESKKVPLTFNYICIASFKMFPEKFCCDEEFKEFPSVDRLNRTMMHLKYVKKGKPYLAGSVEDGYSLTSFGKANAIEVESIINNSIVDKTIKAPTVDKHKKGIGGDYLKLVESKEYKNFLETGKIDNMFIWKFYNVIPYTQVKFITENLNTIKQYAKESSDEKCIEFVEKIEKTI